MIVYKITNKITGKLYIGQTTMPLSRRWAVHKAAKRISPLTSSLKKHGAQNFAIEEIARATSLDELARLEIFYIKSFNTLYPKGYNLSSGGVSNKGCPAWNKGLKGLKAPKSAFKKGNKPWNAGQPQLSEETRRKQSIAKLGKHISPDTEFKAGQPSAFKGRKHSPEALAKISENGNKRAVRHIETAVIYTSIVEASKATKVAKSHLRRLALKGIRFEFVSI
jgi:group I intron endonuclease